MVDGKLMRVTRRVDTYLQFDPRATIVTEPASDWDSPDSNPVEDIERFVSEMLPKAKP